MKSIKLTHNFILNKSFWYIKKDINRFQNLGNEGLWILCWKQILDEMNEALRSTRFLQQYNWKIFITLCLWMKLKPQYSREGWHWAWVAPSLGLESPAEYKEVSRAPVHLVPGCGCHVTGYLTCLSSMKNCILQLGAKETLHPQAVLQQDVSFSGIVRANVADKSVSLN